MNFFKVFTSGEIIFVFAIYTFISYILTKIWVFWHNFLTEQLCMHVIREYRFEGQGVILAWVHIYTKQIILFPNPLFSKITIFPKYLPHRLGEDISFFPVSIRFCLNSSPNCFFLSFFFYHFLFVVPVFSFFSYPSFIMFFP